MCRVIFFVSLLISSTAFAASITDNLQFSYHDGELKVSIPADYYDASETTIKAKPRVPIEGLDEKKLYFDSQESQSQAVIWKTALGLPDTLQLDTYNILIVARKTSGELDTKSFTFSNNGPTGTLVEIAKKTTTTDFSNFYDFAINFLAKFKSLSSVVITVTIGVFLVALVVMLSEYLSLISKSKGFYGLLGKYEDRNVTLDQVNEVIEATKQRYRPFKVPFNEFAEAMVAIDGKMHNTINSERFFTLENIESSIRYHNTYPSVPGWLTSIGILGTFFGLVQGVSTLQITDPDILLSGIENLMSGLWTAFTTSIWGILLAVIFSMVKKLLVAKLEKKIGGIQTRLDYKFKRINVQDLLLLNQSLFKSAFHKSEMQVNEMSMFSMLANLVTVQSESRHHIENMESGIRTLNTSFGSEFFERIAEAVSGPLGHLSQTIQNHLSNLAERDQSGVERMTSEITKNIYEAGEHLSNTIGEFSSIHSEIQTSLSNTTSALDKLIEGNAAQVEAFEIHRANNEGLIKSTRHLIDGISDQFKGNVAEVVKIAESFNHKMIESLNENKSLLGETQTMHSQIISDTSSLTENLTKVIQSLELISREYTQTIRDTHNICVENHKLLESTVPEINESLKRTSHLSNESTERLASTVSTINSQQETQLLTLKEHESILEKAKSLVGQSSSFIANADSMLNGIKESAITSTSAISNLDTIFSRSIPSIREASDSLSNSSLGLKAVSDSLKSTSDSLTTKTDAFKEHLNSHLDGLSARLTLTFSEFDTAIATLAAKLNSSLSINQDSITILNASIEDFCSSTKTLVERTAKIIKDSKRE